MTIEVRTVTDTRNDDQKAYDNAAAGALTRGNDFLRDLCVMSGSAAVCSCTGRMADAAAYKTAALAQRDFLDTHFKKVDAEGNVIFDPIDADNKERIAGLV